ncbi:MAG: glycosyltransferase family 4 protein [Patescibacteria group bacterium]
MSVPQLPKGKILLVTTDYPPATGGVAWYYENLVRRLNAAETPSVSPMARERFRGGDARVVVLLLGRWTLTPWWPLLIFPLLLKTIKLKTDVWWVGQVLPVGTVVWLLSHLWPKYYIVSTHGMDVLLPLYSPRKRWLMKRILNRATLITTNSEWTKQKIIENYFSRNKEQGTRNKIEVIYPEPKPKRKAAREEILALRTRLGIPHDAKVLLTVSRLVARKGIDCVLRALPEVWRRSPHLHYVIVGEGDQLPVYQSIVYQLAPSVGVNGHLSIHFVGKASDEELAVYYSLADEFILLPRESHGDVEGFGIVFLEADQYHVPIIATLSGGTGEALQKCKQVTVVHDPFNIHEVANAIISNLKPIDG